MQNTDAVSAHAVRRAAARDLWPTLVGFRMWSPRDVNGYRPVTEREAREFARWAAEHAHADLIDAAREWLSQFAARTAQALELVARSIIATATDVASDLWSSPQSQRHGLPPWLRLNSRDLTPVSPRAPAVPRLRMA